MLMATTIFDTSFFEIVTITFTSLILIEFLNILGSVNRLDWKITGSIALSVLTYLFSLFFLRSLMQLSEVDLQFLIKVSIMTFLAYAPIKLCFVIKSNFFPSMTDKVRHEAKEKARLEKAQTANNDPNRGSNRGGSNYSTIR